MENETQSYTESLAELEKILSALRSGSCDVDTLAQSTRRAVELLKFCRARLTTTEDELRNILESLSTSDS